VALVTSLVSRVLAKAISKRTVRNFDYKQNSTAKVLKDSTQRMVSYNKIATEGLTPTLENNIENRLDPTKSKLKQANGFIIKNNYLTGMQALVTNE